MDSPSIPKVSVIIPAFNAARFIGATLASACSQSHANLEIIVADDGSTDTTMKVVRSHAEKDPRIRLVEGPHVGLPGRVRNWGIQQATGDFIALLDADDLWTRSKLAEQLKALAARPESSFCHCPFLEFTGSDGDIPLDVPAPVERASGLCPRESLRGHAGYRRLLLGETFIGTPTLLFRREMLDRIGPFSESPLLGTCEDTDFILRLYRAGEAVFVPKVHVFVRKHDANTTRTKDWRHVFELYRLAEDRGDIPPRLMGRVWSGAWTTRAEQELRAGERGWRGSMRRAWRENPMNPRRLPALAASAMPRALAERFYFALRALGRGGRE